MIFFIVDFEKVPTVVSSFVIEHINRSDGRRERSYSHKGGMVFLFQRRRAIRMTGWTDWTDTFRRKKAHNLFNSDSTGQTKLKLLFQDNIVRMVRYYPNAVLLYDVLQVVFYFSIVCHWDGVYQMSIITEDSTRRYILDWGTRRS